MAGKLIQKMKKKIAKNLGVHISEVDSHQLENEDIVEMHKILFG